MVNPWLNNLIQHVSIAIAVLKSENCDAYFISKTLDMIQQMLIGYSSKKMITQDVQSKWIFRISRVAKDVPECQIKLTKLLTLCMEACQAIC